LNYNDPIHRFIRRIANVHVLAARLSLSLSFSLVCLFQLQQSITAKSNNNNTIE